MSLYAYLVLFPRRNKTLVKNHKIFKLNSYLMHFTEDDLAGILAAMRLSGSNKCDDCSAILNHKCDWWS